MGERIWMREGRRFPAGQHPRVFYVLMATSLVNLVALVWGIVSSDIVLTIIGTINVLIAKSWSNDRMVWLFTERSRENEEYRKWLY